MTKTMANNRFSLNMLIEHMDNLLNITIFHEQTGIVMGRSLEDHNEDNDTHTHTCLFKTMVCFDIMFSFPPTFFLDVLKVRVDSSAIKTTASA